MRRVETKERADEPDEKNQEDQPPHIRDVYELYGLTDEEIEMVEAAHKE